MAHSDSRGALLRDTIRRVTTHYEAEGLSIELKQLLSDCVLRGTPCYQFTARLRTMQRLGRVPHLLPGTNVSLDDAMPGAMRRAQRTREKSAKAAKIGDLVDYHRTASIKDASG